MLFSVVSNFAETLFWFCEKLRHSRHTAVETIIYYSTYYLEKKKSGWGNHISFQATPICWFYDARCWKKKKDFCSALLLSSPVSKFCVTTQKQTNKQKPQCWEKEKKAVFKTAIVIAVKKIMKIRKIDWNLLTRKKRKQKQTKQEQEKTKQTTRVSPLFSSSSNLAMMMNASKKTVIIITDIIIPK